MGRIFVPLASETTESTNRIAEIELVDDDGSTVPTLENGKLRCSKWSSMSSVVSVLKQSGHDLTLLALLVVPLVESVN